MLEVAAVAFGLAGVADLAAVMDELVGEVDPAVAWDYAHEFLFDFFGGFGFGEAKAAGDAEDVGVDDHALGFAETDTEYDVGGLAGGAGDGDELGEGLGDLAVEVGDDLAGGTLDGFGLVAEEAGGANDFLEFGQGGLGHGGGGGEAFEKRGRDHVDADVSALGGEDGSDEKLPGRAVVEGALDLGVGFVEGGEDGGDAAWGLVAAWG